MPKLFFKNLPQNSKCQTLNLQYALGKLLVLPQIEKRYANPNGIQIDLMQHIRGVLGILEAAPLTKLSGVMLVLRIWLVQMFIKKDVRN